MDNTIYVVLGVLALVYFIVFFKNKRGTKRRRSRKFMEGKRRHEKN